MDRFQDISSNELNLKNQYHNNFFNNVNSSHKFIIDNFLENKTLSSKNLNNIIEEIIILEKDYHINFIDILNNYKTTYQDSIDNLSYHQEFDKLKTYNVNNFVLYNKEFYYCHTKPPVGTLPTNTNYWTRLGLQGKKAVKSLGVNFIGSWVNSHNYVKYDMVNYQNKLYVSKTSNKNKSPKNNLTDWELVTQVESSSIRTQKETPININNNEIWFQIL